MQPEFASNELIARLCSLSERVVFFPVRHHSPACARAVRELILRLKPAAVLVEGPTDFNARMDELFLSHRLPIAIYTWVALPEQRMRGAFYPFCEYSPEWQALQAARVVGAATAFIDLPWSEMVSQPEVGSNLYADAALRRGDYMQRLCAAMEVEGFDALWDCLTEQDGELSSEDILERAHHFCATRRLVEGDVQAEDWLRESFMAQRIQDAMARHTGQIFVVTGGYHSLGLLDYLEGGRALITQPATETQDGGLALTPYAFEDLDSLTGYDAGMPNPGFYDAAWKHGHAEVADLLLQRVAAVLRERKQTASTADLIAVRSTARALATLRGNEFPWRRDLMDGIIAALVKDDAGATHPFLAVLNEVLRGGERGELAPGTPAPPFVHELKQQLAKHGLELKTTPIVLQNDLTKPQERERSVVLHRVALLGIPGFTNAGGVDFSVRDDLSGLTETWGLQWEPQFEARAVECSRYGPTLREAAWGRLQEMALSATGAAAAALLMVKAAECGLASELTAGSGLHGKLEQLIRSEQSFIEAAVALDHLLYLYQFDEVLSTHGLPGLGGLLREAWERAAWLLDFIGTNPPEPVGIPPALRALVEVLQRTGGALQLSKTDLVEALLHLESHVQQLPLLRGAAAGALWLLQAQDASQAPQQLRAFADPTVLGDYLTGLFTLARELVSRSPELLRAISEMINGFEPEEFLAALPSLRLAFTFFPPREKFDLAKVLFDGNTTETILATRRLSVGAMEMAAAAAFENRLLAMMRKYGLREPLQLASSSHE
jgi:hypothetical protein